MIVASRILKLQQGDRYSEVPVRIFAPEQAGGDWSCRYEIDWPDGTRQFAAHGLDSMQALVLALNMIGVEIYTSDHHTAKALMWGKPGGGYGFPVAGSARDLLEGDDAKFL